MASCLLWLAVATVAASVSTPSALSWRKCDDTYKLSKELQCANISVPIDWDNPNGEKFSLVMARLLRKSNSKALRVGSLFINPGGPGNSATSLVSKIADGGSYVPGLPPVSQSLLDSFDLIGVDPRGVGLSSALRCDTTIWNERVSQFPRSQEEFNRLVDKNRRLGESCIAQSGNIAKFMDTVSSAKDHEAVRAALDEEMNWLGLSYGTMLGAQYAQLFPNKIRAMVLDGVLQHSQSEAVNIQVETSAYAIGLKEFFRWAETDGASPLKGQNVEDIWNSVLKQAATKPLPALSCDGKEGGCYKDVTEDEIRLNAQGLLIFPITKPVLAQALLQASQGDATILSTQVLAKNDMHAFPLLGTACQDWSTSSLFFADLEAKLRLGDVVAPLTRGASQSWTVQASCVGWPTPRRNPPTKLRIQTAAPILIAHSDRDPSTGYALALGMREEIQNSTFLTRAGTGHTSWLLGGETAEAINNFLITKSLPAPGTVLNS